MDKTAYELVHVTTRYHNARDKLNPWDNMRYSEDADEPYFFIAQSEIVGSQPIISADLSDVSVGFAWLWNTTAICIAALPNTGGKSYLNNSVLIDAVATNGKIETFHDSLNKLLMRAEQLRLEAYRRISSALPVSTVHSVDFYAVYEITYSGDEWEGDHEWKLVGFLDLTKLKAALC